MKIGIVTTWFERGAAMVSRAFRDVLAKNNDVFIYARKGERYGRGDPVWDTPDVTWGPMRSREDKPRGIKWSHLKKWAVEKQIDLLIFNEEHNWAPIVFARRELDCKIAAYIDYYTQDTVPFFQLYDSLICNTRRHHSVFDWHDNAVYIPWGTDINLFCPSSDSESAAEPIRFFHSAGMNPDRKGTLIALKAFQAVRGECQFNLHVQQPLDGYPEIKRICESDSRIRVIEKTIGAPGLYYLGDVYVYPTILEGIGLSVPEAMSCGLPVVITDNGPMNEFVASDEVGRRVRPKAYRGRSDGYYWAESYCDPSDFAAQMQALVDRPQDLEQMKRATRQYAVEHFDWEKNASGLSAHLESTLGRNREDLQELEERSFEYMVSRLSRKKQLVADLAMRIGIRNEKFRHIVFA